MISVRIAAILRILAVGGVVAPWVHAHHESWSWAPSLPAWFSNPALPIAGLFVLWLLQSYLGLWDPVVVDEAIQPAVHGVVLRTKGNYSQIPFLMRRTKEYISLVTDEETKCGVGIYLDDPRATPEAKCRWAMGFLVPTRALADRAVAAAKEQDKADAVAFSIPASRSTRVVMKWKTVLTPAVQPERVYPHLKNMSGPALELYEEQGHGKMYSAKYVVLRENADAINVW